MILDILAVLFFVLGFALILWMIGERRRDVLHGLGKARGMKQSDLYRQNAENCMLMADAAQGEPYHRYRRKEQARAQRYALDHRSLRAGGVRYSRFRLSCRLALGLKAKGKS